MEPENKKQLGDGLLFIVARCEFVSSAPAKESRKINEINMSGYRVLLCLPRSSFCSLLVSRPFIFQTWLADFISRPVPFQLKSLIAIESSSCE